MLYPFSGYVPRLRWRTPSPKVTYTPEVISSLKWRTSLRWRTVYQMTYPPPVTYLLPPLTYHPPKMTYPPSDVTPQVTYLPHFGDLPPSPRRPPLITYPSMTYSPTIARWRQMPHLIDVHPQRDVPPFRWISTQMTYLPSDVIWQSAWQYACHKCYTLLIIILYINYFWQYLSYKLKKSLIKRYSLLSSTTLMYIYFKYYIG